MPRRLKLYITLSPEAKVYALKLSERRGLSQSAFIEQLLRNEAERLNINATPQEIEKIAE